MLMIQHGDLCVVTAPGTEIERFSVKTKRPVVVAYIVEDTAYVYPLTARKPTGKGPQMQAGPGSWVVLDQGLFAVKLAELNSTGEQLAAFPKLRQHIDRDLRQRESRARTAENDQLTHRGLSELAKLKKPEEPKSTRPKPVPAKKSNEEIWQEYLDHDLEAEFKNPGFDGRSKKSR
ncbi:MAG: hypothetical protein JST40_07300 [Armatimonadetes bacterium]|nr:hypothetical protein [Armatimonadota bacterium]